MERHLYIWGLGSHILQPLDNPILYSVAETTTNLCTFSRLDRSHFSIDFSVALIFLQDCKTARQRRRLDVGARRVRVKGLKVMEEPEGFVVVVKNIFDDLNSAFDLIALQEHDLRRRTRDQRGLVHFLRDLSGRPRCRRSWNIRVLKGALQWQRQRPTAPQPLPSPLILPSTPTQTMIQGIFYARFFPRQGIHKLVPQHWN